MKNYIAIAAALIFLLGGFYLGRKTAPSLQDSVDTSQTLLPNDVITGLQDKEKRAAFISLWRQIGDEPASMIITKFEDSAPPIPVELPAGIPNPPDEITLFEPAKTAKWVSSSHVTGGEGLDAAKEGWTVINLWASWCLPCISELPDIDATAKALADAPIKFFTVNADTLGRDTPQSARAIFDERGVQTLALIMPRNKEEIRAFLTEVGIDPDHIGLPYSIIYAPGGVPYAAFSGGAVDGEAHWSSPEGLAFFRALAASQ